MVTERYDQNAQVALLKVVREVLDLDTTALTMADVEESMILRDALDHIDISQPSQSMASLSDCTILAHALKTLDPSFDTTQLDRSLGPSRWLTRKKNLLIVYKGIFAYIRRSCRELMALAKVYDIRTTVKDPDDQKMAQLVSIIVVAACLGENNSEYVKRIQTLNPMVLEPIMRIIVSKREECKRLEASTDMDEIIDRVLQTRDVDLAYEEEHASILFELETSRKQASDLMSRLEHLQKNHDDALRELNKRQDELELLKQSGTDNEYSAERDRQRILEQEDVIASQEGEIQGFNETIRGLKAEIRDFERKVKKMDDLNDQVTELRHQNTELSKKANAVERYKQKIEAQQGLLTELQNLHEEKARWKKEHDDTMSQMNVLEEQVRKARMREEDQLNAITETGQEIEDLKIGILKREEELISLRSLRKHDERVINELQQQLRSGDVNASAAGGLASPTFPEEPASLAQELGGFEDQSAQYSSLSLEIERLRAENELYKNNMSGEEMTRLKDERDSSRTQASELRRERTEYLEKIASQQKLIENLMKGATGEGTKAYSELETKFSSAASDSANDRKRIQDLTAQLGELQRKFSVASATLETINADELEAIEKIKEVELTMSRSLKGELELERQEKTKLQDDLNQCKADLVSAYQSKEQLRKDLDEAKELQEKVAGQQTTEELKELKLRLDKRTKDFNKLQENYNQLYNKWKAHQEGSAQKEIIRNLERENRLMATAWHDLTSRIQSNHVVLQRRSDVPKAWINKQRQMVNATTPRR